MASAGLAQIDENLSLVQTNVNEPLALPNLLVHSVPDSPEGWHKRISLGDSTPEVWPKTPTPRGLGLRPRSGFALGDQTPEYWPELAPSFRMDAQQPYTGNNLQPVLAPMWPLQCPCPFGMVIGGNIVSFANMGVPRDMVLPSSTNNSVSGCTASGLADEASRAGSNSKSKPTPSRQKPSRTVNRDAGADDTCPVAVYVDLSALREQ